MITPVRYEIRCDAWDCSNDSSFAPWSRPLVVEARSAREAARKACQAGWQPPPNLPASTKYWWCPRHAQVANTRREQLAADRASL